MSINHALTAEQMAALREYAKRNGRAWKRQLERDWQSGRVPEGPILRHVRNIIGPSGLKRLNLSEASTT